MGYHHISRKEDHKYQSKRNVSFYHKNEKYKVLKTKSHSLDAIIEELYLSGGEDNSIYDPGLDFSLNPKKALIPRIKLTRSVSSVREEKRYQQLYKMSAKSEIFNVPDRKIPQKVEINTEESIYDTVPPSIYSNNNNYEAKKPDENYFAKNFDECMKRLQLIEKDHEMIEKDDIDLQFYYLQKQKEMEMLEKKVMPEFQVVSETEISDKKEKEIEKNSSGNLVTGYSQETKDEEKETNGSESKENEEPICNWYSNLKQQFEKPGDESEEPKTKEITCRITGATLKNSTGTQKPENKETAKRHYFSRLVKSNKSLIDEELPDPDKVKNIREMFQENLNSTLKRKLDKKLGGSLQNINIKSIEQMFRPLSAQCNRDDKEMNENQHGGEKENKIPETEELKHGEKDFQVEVSKRKLFEKYEKDMKLGRDFKGKKLLQSKWTDTGSVSSGVSSDLSSYDTDLECYSREGTEQEPDDVTISDDDLLEEVKDKHYVPNEILEKIRSFGTSVTYYGGEMITCSVGPLLSPTTQAIMEEIGEMYCQKTGATRSFNEFYRKYAENNETNRKKKLGRTRSFGQNDLFHKPLNNTEIEMYKNDLEFEIGIKKPSGNPINGLKKKLTKSCSLGSGSDKLMEMPMPIIKIDAVTDGDISKSPSSEPENEEITKTNTEEEAESCLLENCTKNMKNEENSKCEHQIEVVENCNNESNSNDVIENVKPEENNIKVKLPENSEKKEHVLFRSKSISEQFVCSINTGENEELPSKEILFGYEKSLINGKRNSDMKFEEFEVCETVEEKLEKLQEINSSGGSSSETTETKIEKPKSVEAPRRKWNINLNEETESKPKSRIEFNRSKSNFETKYNSRWPIETTVMVDIQKNNEQTPKLVTNTKTAVKTKIRLF